MITNGFTYFATLVLIAGLLIGLLICCFAILVIAENTENPEPAAEQPAAAARAQGAVQRGRPGTRGQGAVSSDPETMTFSRPSRQTCFA